MMPSALNLRAPRFSIAAGDTVEESRQAALRLGQRRAMERGRQSVRPARYESEILLWLVQDVRGIAPKPEPLEELPPC